MPGNLNHGLPRHGYKISLYPSGEMSGAQYSRNVQSKASFGSKSGGMYHLGPYDLAALKASDIEIYEKISARWWRGVTVQDAAGVAAAVERYARVSRHMTRRGRQNIRRAVENSPYKLNVFMTLTFSPTHVWRHGPYNCFDVLEYSTITAPVPHTYAKKRLVQFLNTLSHRQRRTVASRGTGDQLQYIWTAELQKNGNIHYHLLLNTRFPIAWLTKTWKQANNSVDVRSLNNADHAAAYISKYIAKDEGGIIEGRRYYITDGLRKAMKPAILVYEGMDMKKEIQELLEAMKTEIEKAGGTVIDFGFHIPKPRRSVPYKDKKGKKQFRRGTSSRIQMPILETLDEHYNAKKAPF